MRERDYFPNGVIFPPVSYHYPVDHPYQYRKLLIFMLRPSNVADRKRTRGKKVRDRRTLTSSSFGFEILVQQTAHRIF